MHPTSVRASCVILVHMCVFVNVPLRFQLHLSCWGLLLVAIMGVYMCVCICGSGWSSPVFFLLIVLYCSALAVPEGNGGLGGGRWGKAAGVAEGVLAALVRRADDRPNKASQGLGPSLSALPPRCPLCSLLPPRFATPSHSPPNEHMWSGPNGTQLDFHLLSLTDPSSLPLSVQPQMAHL